MSSEVFYVIESEVKNGKWEAVDSPRKKFGSYVDAVKQFGHHLWKNPEVKYRIVKYVCRVVSCEGGRVRPASKC